MTTSPSTATEVRDLIAQHCFTRDLAPHYVDEIVEHAEVRRYPEGSWLFTEGGAADEFHLLVDGRVAIQTHSPGRGDLVVDTVEACETVGWSWLVPPYRWFFSARAVTDVRVVTVDAAALRALAERDPALGFALMQQVASVMLGRMQAARVRLVDVYGIAP